MRKGWNPHRITSVEAKAFTLSGDKPLRRIVVQRRRHNGAHPSLQPLIAYVRGKKPIKSDKQTRVQYVEGVMTFVQTEE